MFFHAPTPLTIRRSFPSPKGRAGRSGERDHGDDRGSKTR